MKNEITLLLTFILFICINQLFGQPMINKQDTLKPINEKAIIKEYFRRQQNLSLPFEDTVNINTNVKMINEFNQKMKFVILCFNLSQSNEDEISSLNKLALEYQKILSPIVINADELNKYQELFTNKEFKSLRAFIFNKTASQKKSISFPVILILDANGVVSKAWSGDKAENGLERENFYFQIKASLDAISKQN